MNELKPGELTDSENADVLEKLIPEIESGLIIFAYQRAALRSAVEALRRAAPENKPLTLDELRQMDGEPVKVVEDGECLYGLMSLSGHFLAPKEEVITLCSGNFYLLREMAGNFEVYPAYTRKPEQEEK